MGIACNISKDMYIFNFLYEFRREKNWLFSKKLLFSAVFSLYSSFFFFHPSNCSNYLSVGGLTGMESSKETGCQVPEGPILCINNCGFFGSAATMNMCSKCHKDMVFQQQQVSLATSSIENIVKASSSSVNEREPVLVDMVKTETGAVEVKESFSQSSSGLMSGKSSDTKAVEGPKRCTSCHKRVGLTGFNCKCGHLFCSVHRYSDKHDCQFDYRTAAQDAIAKANPLVKGEKLEKI